MRMIYIQGPLCVLKPVCVRFLHGLRETVCPEDV